MKPSDFPADFSPKDRKKLIFLKVDNKAKSIGKVVRKKNGISANILYSGHH